MNGSKILIIDDDPRLRRLMEFALANAGAETVCAIDGKDGLRKFYSEHPNLVVLDLMLPEMNGWDTCKNIRQLSDVPIIMVTARGEEEDIIRGLDMGADDYITKPFSPKVLVARARAAIRRSQLNGEEKKAETTNYSDDFLAVNLEEHRIFAGGEPVKLTSTEFKLLAYLLDNSGRVLTFEQILENVWGWDTSEDVNYIRVYIWHLRSKIEPDPKNPQYILNVQGMGYRFERRGHTGKG